MMLTGCLSLSSNSLWMMMMLLISARNMHRFMKKKTSKSKCLYISRQKTTTTTSGYLCISNDGREAKKKKSNIVSNIAFLLVRVQYGFVVAVVVYIHSFLIHLDWTFFICVCALCFYYGLLSKILRILFIYEM